jgi:hypothetical protein
MRLTEHRRKLLTKLKRADIPAEMVINKGNQADLEWLSNAGLASLNTDEMDESLQWWAITEAGEQALQR